MQMNYNADLTMEGFINSLKNNEELVSAFDAVSKKIDAVFNEDGSIISGTVGAAAANFWEDKANSFFQKTLLVETEKFLLDKLKPIIESVDSFTKNTVNTYYENKTNEPKAGE